MEKDCADRDPLNDPAIGVMDIPNWVMEEKIDAKTIGVYVMLIHLADMYGRIYETPEEIADRLGLTLEELAQTGTRLAELEVLTLWQKTDANGETSVFRKVSIFRQRDGEQE